MEIGASTASLRRPRVPCPPLPSPATLPPACGCSSASPHSRSGPAAASTRRGLSRSWTVVAIATVCEEAASPGVVEPSLRAMSSTHRPTTRAAPARRTRAAGAVDSQTSPASPATQLAGDTYVQTTAKAFVAHRPYPTRAVDASRWRCLPEVRVALAVKQCARWATPCASRLGATHAVDARS